MPEATFRLDDNLPVFFDHIIKMFQKQILFLRQIFFHMPVVSHRPLKYLTAFWEIPAFLAISPDVILSITNLLLINNDGILNVHFFIIKEALREESITKIDFLIIFIPAIFSARLLYLFLYGIQLLDNFGKHMDHSAVTSCCIFLFHRHTCPTNDIVQIIT